MYIDDRVGRSDGAHTPVNSGYVTPSNSRRDVAATAGRASFAKKGPSVKNSARATLAIAVAVTLAVGTAVAVQASPNPTPAQTQAKAADTAATFVSLRPSALHASADDAFIQHPVISSAGLNYVPYDRTYKGLTVIGGDFVVVIDRRGYEAGCLRARHAAPVLGDHGRRAGC